MERFEVLEKMQSFRTNISFNIQSLEVEATSLRKVGIIHQATKQDKEKGPSNARLRPNRIWPKA